MEQLPDARAADIIEEMGPDDASDLLGDLPAARAAGLLREMEPEAAEDVRELLRYPDDSAGGMMTTSFVSCPRDYTVRQAIEFCWMALPKERRNSDEVEKQFRRIPKRAQNILRPRRFAMDRF